MISKNADTPRLTVELHILMTDKEQRKAFYRVLDLNLRFGALGEEQGRFLGQDKYVPDLHSESGTDIVGALREAIEFSAGEAGYLFSGMRGSGKTTELLRMQSEMAAEGEFFVLYTDARDHFNLVARVEIGDFLLTLCAALAETVAANDQLGTDFAKRGIWSRFIDTLFAEVELKEMSGEVSWALAPGVNAKIAGKAALRHNPGLKEQIQRKLRERSESIATQADVFFDEVAAYVRERTGRSRVLLLVDSLEHLRGTTRAESLDVYESLATLFTRHATELQPRSMSLVYSIPPYLTAISQGFAAFFGGGRVFPLAMVHIFHREPGRRTVDDGLILMREVVARRFPQWDRFFAEASLKRLAASSGGDLRDFFRLLRACLTSSDQSHFPYDDLMLSYAEATLREDFRFLSNEDLAWLVKVEETRQIQLPSLKDLPQLAALLDGKAMLNYRNGDDWYDVHPLLRDRVRQHAAAAP